MLLSKNITSNIINAGLSAGADFCEVYVEENLISCMELRSSKVEYISGKDKGVGIRLFYGNEEFYTYTNCLDEKNLLLALKSLTMRKNEKQHRSLLKEALFVTPSIVQSAKEQKLDLEKEKLLLQKLDRDIRSFHSSISQCNLVLKKALKKVQIANSDSLFSEDIRPYQFFRVSSIAEGDGEKQSGFRSMGQAGLQTNLSEEKLRVLALQSSEEALKNLKADPAPAGKFPVIINKGFGGVIFHEACGHGMETTSVADKFSIFSDKLDTKIADSCVSAYDDGTLKGKFGFINKDDEGQDSQKTTLIEKGVLKSYMVDKLGSQKTDYKVTGSGRRQDYKFAPTSRMRNTYIGRGESSLEEMIKDVDYGLFAETLGGGSVTPGTGNYNFSVTSARLIKNGKLDKAIKGASLIGNGLDTLSKIKKVGTDLELSAGHCGSISGWVPVTVGQPPILVSELTVGGHS